MGERPGYNPTQESSAGNALILHEENPHNQDTENITKLPETLNTPTPPHNETRPIPPENHEKNEKKQKAERLSFADQLTSQIKTREEKCLEQRYGKGLVGKIRRKLETTGWGKAIKVGSKILAGTALASTATILTGGGAAFIAAPMLYSLGMQTAVEGGFETLQYLMRGRKERLKLEDEKRKALKEIEDGPIKQIRELEQQLEARKIDQEAFAQALEPLLITISKSEAAILEKENSHMALEKKMKTQRTVASAATTAVFGLLWGLPMGVGQHGHRTVGSLFNGFNFIYNPGDIVSHTGAFKMGGSLVHTMGTALPTIGKIGIGSAMMGLFMKAAGEIATTRGGNIQQEQLRAEVVDGLLRNNDTVRVARPPQSETRPAQAAPTVTEKTKTRPEAQRPVEKTETLPFKITNELREKAWEKTSRYYELRQRSMAIDAELKQLEEQEKALQVPDALQTREAIAQQRQALLTEQERIRTEITTLTRVEQLFIESRRLERNLGNLVHQHRQLQNNLRALRNNATGSGSAAEFSRTQVALFVEQMNNVAQTYNAMYQRRQDIWRNIHEELATIESSSQQSTAESELVEPAATPEAPPPTKKEFAQFVQENASQLAKLRSSLAETNALLKKLEGELDQIESASYIDKAKFSAKEKEYLDAEKTKKETEHQLKNLKEFSMLYSSVQHKEETMRTLEDQISQARGNTDQRARLEARLETATKEWENVRKSLFELYEKQQSPASVQGTKTAPPNQQPKHTTQESSLHDSQPATETDQPKPEVTDARQPEQQPEPVTHEAPEPPTAATAAKKPRTIKHETPEKQVAFNDISQEKLVEVATTRYQHVIDQIDGKVKLGSAPVPDFETFVAQNELTRRAKRLKELDSKLTSKEALERVLVQVGAREEKRYQPTHEISNLPPAEQQRLNHTQKNFEKLIQNLTIAPEQAGIQIKDIDTLKTYLALPPDYSLKQLRDSIRVAFNILLPNNEGDVRGNAIVAAVNEHYQTLTQEAKLHDKQRPRQHQHRPQPVEQPALSFKRTYQEFAREPHVHEAATIITGYLQRNHVPWQQVENALSIMLRVDGKAEMLPPRIIDRLVNTNLDWMRDNARDTEPKSLVISTLKRINSQVERLTQTTVTQENNLELAAKPKHPVHTSNKKTDPPFSLENN
ncbi:MAG: hypothetical protein BWY68_00003 [bacterium ADurb.Bin400]|nr:MAG: hypothetical protein BWY68_00003 [bacterium ADurb.Bin400]